MWHKISSTVSTFERMPEEDPVELSEGYGGFCTLP